MSQSDALRGDALYRAVFEVNTAIKLVIDPADGRIIDANPAAVAFYGWPLETLRTMRVSDINTLTREEIAAEMDAARRLERTYFRFRHRTARGDVRAVEIHSAPITVDGQELLFSIIHDVTDRDRLEEHLRRSQRLEAIGQLAGGVAHDFNNLLTVILSAARLVRARLPGEHASVGFIGDIEAAAKRGADLTRQLLAFSRRQVMEPVPLGVRDVVAALVPLLEHALGAALTLELDAADVPPVIADPAQLEQVVMNLVLNARDASPDGGTIRITVGTSAGDARALVPPGAWVTVAVRDEGIGMDDATRTRVFEPFFTTKPDGTGMGLATVYGIVAQSGGHVAVESAPGAGATFTVYLPVATARPRDAAPAPAVAAPAAAATILLVDDERAVRTTLGQLLADLGHTVHLAGDADEALELADRLLDELDVVVTDVVMPGRSGVELAQALLARRPDLGCVVMSGDLRDQALDVLPARVVRLAKPFGVDALHDAVGRAR